MYNLHHVPQKLGCVSIKVQAAPPEKGEGWATVRACATIGMNIIYKVTADSQI